MSGNEKKVPIRRFKEFEDAGDWEQCKIGEIGIVQTCKRIFKEQTSESGDIPFYKNGTLGLKADAYISGEVFEEYKKIYPYPRVGDVLISVVGSIGRTAEYKGNAEYFQDSNIVWLKTDDNIIDRIFLKISYQIIDWLIEGSTIKHLYNDNILASKIWIPSSIDEQKAIGGFFDFIDDLIILQQRKLEKMKALKKAYLIEMFPTEGECKPKLRFAGFTDDWEQCKLGEVATIRTGYPFDSNDFDDKGAYLVITNGNIQNDSPTVDSSLGSRINFNNAILSEYVLNPNDILVTMDGTVGRTAKVVEQKQILAQRVGRLTAKSDPEFLYQCLNTGEFFKKMALISHGGTIKHISLNEISSYISYMPASSEEQTKIGKFFKSVDNLITIHQHKLEKLQNIKKAYLNEMFI